MLKVLTIVTMILTMLVMLALAAAEIVGLHEIIQSQRETIQIHENFIYALLEQNEEPVGRSEINERVIEAVITSYSPHRKQTDCEPHVAASMRRVREGTVAVSRDLFWAGWVFGKRLYIEGYGIYEINDLMNQRFSRRIDVFQWSQKKALAFGAVERRVALLD